MIYPDPYQFRLKSRVVKRTKSLSSQVQDWGIKLLNVSREWKDTQGEGVKVAVLDTGVTEHPDLIRNIRGGINFTSQNKRDYIDRAGHGTHVAGIIAGVDNDFGIVGVAPKASIYAVKVLDDDGAGTYEWIAKGILWAIANKMDIISMSIGSPTPSYEINKAMRLAYKQNITMVCAAGNDGDDDEYANNIDFPARYPEAIAVGAINKARKRSYFSGNGPRLDVVAPGEDIYSTYLNNDYAVLSGTSMATPFITGLVALMLAKHRKNKANKTPVDNQEQIREHLIRACDDEGEVGKDAFYGYGVINPRKAMNDLAVKGTRA